MTSGRAVAALLTEGITLPTPAMNRVHLAIIADAICRAWELVVANWPETAREEAERIVNSALVTHLLVEVKERRTPFSTMVSTVVRGAEQPSYNGEKLEKRPDLNFYLTNGNPQLPLVGECKIIDLSDRKGLDKYKRNGVDRFVDGDYAWANSEGFMVAYVRDATQAGTSLAAATGSEPEPWQALARMHHRSRHARTFAYVDRDPAIEAPGEISLFHVWLDCPRQEVYP